MLHMYSLRSGRHVRVQIDPEEIENSKGGEGRVTVLIFESNTQAFCTL